jgi:hypothetical protein
MQPGVGTRKQAIGGEPVFRLRQSIHYPKLVLVGR